jgi:hypothetical protein
MSPWTQAAQVLEVAFTGPIATGLALVAIVVGGLMFAFGEGGAKRTMAGVIFGVGMGEGRQLQFFRRGNGETRPWTFQDAMGSSLCFPTRIAPPPCLPNPPTHTACSFLWRVGSFQLLLWAANG